MMDHASPQPNVIPATPPASPRRGAGLALVSSPFRLAEPAQPAPEEWRKGRDDLLGWLGVETDVITPAPARRLGRMADWALAAAGAGAAHAAPVFAPWIGWSPAAFQHGGWPGLPNAHYVASYLIEHARGAGIGQNGTDVVLMSPHPSACLIEEAGAAPVPRPAVLRAMIAAARAEGRERVAIILHARQRNAVARQLLAAGKGLTRAGLTLDIITIEEALPPLMQTAGLWDAIIAMPDLRSTIFTMLSVTSGVRGAWPMLWLTGDSARRITHITSEVPGDGSGRAQTCCPLDAPALIHALTLCLHAGGAHGPARRLHDAWANLRDSGVTTAGRGRDAPYVTAVEHADFLSLLQRGAASSKRRQAPWRALENAQTATSGSQVPHLRVVASHPDLSPRKKGR